MSASEDVKTLFRRFGGEPDSYQEVVRERQAVQALGKWAMLGQVDLQHVPAVPGVNRAVRTSATRPAASGMQVEEQRAVLRSLPPAPAPTAPPEVASTPVAPPEITSKPKEAELTEVQAKVSVEPVKRTSVADLSHTGVEPEAQTTARTSRLAASKTAPVADQEQVHEENTRLSPLAARLKGLSSPEPALPPEQPESHSLSGLFGRLSKPPTSGPKPGVLRRKFNR